MWLYVAAGGMVGTLARYYLQGVVQPRGGSFPTGTLLVNILGSLALGFIARFAAETAVVSPAIRAGLTIGVCGGFTTMSTFAFETVALVGDGQWGRASIYLLATVLGSVLAVVVGAAAADRLV